MHDQPHPGRPDRSHLRAVPDGLQLTLNRSRPVREPGPGPRSGRVRLGLWQRQDAEAARQLVDQLTEADADGLTPARLAFTLGRLHGAAMNLLDIIDAITEP